MNRNKDKKEIDPEELMRRKFKAKCQFRALYRLVLANVYWLVEGVDNYEGEDVKRRVEQALRVKQRKKQLLTISDKALLNKPLADRTDHEKKYIYRIIGGLKCFKRYPNHVKKKLAAVTFFQYYSPNRVIVREHQEAFALYFIVTGEVTVSHLVYDELFEKEIDQVVGKLHAGEMFGEVSLLHNIPRTATVTTDDHCELLQLMKEDFKTVLQASLQAQWDEVLHAMTAFTYFDALDEVSRREGCIVAKMKTYAINETILGDNQGVANHVYFVLSGQCQMIESMKIYVTTRLGKQYYTLHDPWEPEEESEEDLEKKYIYLYKDLSKSDTETNIGNVSLHERLGSAKRAFSKSLGSILKLPSIHGTDPRLNEDGKSKSRLSRSHSKKLSNAHLDFKSHLNLRSLATMKEQSSRENVAVEGTVAMEANTNVVESSTKAEQSKEAEGRENRVSYSEEDVIRVSYSEEGDKRVSYSQADPELKDMVAEYPIGNRRSTGIGESHLSSIMLTPSKDFHKRYSVRYSIKKDPRELRTYFMQVCRFNPGSTFGLGENMRDRRIVALTPVSCMLMPKMWLLQRNTANIWTRIQHYLDKKIPKKEQLFKEWKDQRRWLEYRGMLVDDVVSRSHASNYTTVHDVPYSLRLEESIDL